MTKPGRWWDQQTPAMLQQQSLVEGGVSSESLEMDASFCPWLPSHVHVDIPLSAWCSQPFLLLALHQWCLNSPQPAREPLRGSCLLSEQCYIHIFYFPKPVFPFISMSPWTETQSHTPSHQHSTEFKFHQPCCPVLSQLLTGQLQSTVMSSTDSLQAFFV